MSWVAVAAAAVTGGIGLYASKQAGKKSKTEKAAEQSQLDIMRLLQPFGQQQLDQSQRTLQLPLGFYSTLARGDRGATMQALAPELSALDEADRSTLGSLATLAPRGGASGDVFSRLPFRRNQQTQNLMFGARGAAMDSLAAFGQNQQQTGLNALSLGQAGNSNMLDFGLNRNRQQFDQGSATGAAIFQFLQQFQNRPKTAGTTTTNANPFGVPAGSNGGKASFWGG